MLDEMPIVQALIRQVQSSRTSLHVPGHKNGRLLPQELSQWLGQAAKLDLTELPGLDNLRKPTGCIAQSARLAASHYNARSCFYSVNGSTAGIMAAILACVGDGGSVLFCNPFHLSAWQGLVLADARPHFTKWDYNAKLATFDNPDVADIESALANSSDIKAVFVTSPTYVGTVAPVARLANLAHAYGLPLIVDEAHGAHLGLHRDLPDNSIRAGADVVIQSVHKMLPGLTQTAWVLTQGPHVEDERVQEALLSLETTSPSYLLLASLDAAQAWLRREGKETVAASLPLVQELQSRCRIEGKDNGIHLIRDPYRHFTPTGNQTLSQLLADQLLRSNAVPEYADTSGVLAIFSLAATAKEIDAFSLAWDAWRQNALTIAEIPGLDSGIALYFDNPRLELSPREVYFAPKSHVDLTDAVGRICARPIVPYPPGIPCVWPGQRMDASMVARVFAWINEGKDLLGVEDSRVWVC